jgi:hypothetical protein
MAEVQGHLAAQDVLLNRIAASIGLDPVPVTDTPSDEQPGRSSCATWPQRKPSFQSSPS